MSAPWKKTLEPHATAWWEFSKGLREFCIGLTDEELQDLIDATKYPNQTNCWFATYEVAPMLRREADRVRIARANRRLSEATP